MLSPQCPTCKHYQLEQTCTAFPDGIPIPIFLGQHDHEKPWPGDNGYRWVPSIAEEDLPKDLQGLDDE